MEVKLENSEFFEAPMCCNSELSSLDKKVNAHLHKAVNMRNKSNFEKMKGEIKKLKSEIAELRQKYDYLECKLCMDRDVKVLIQPCGHLSCKKCVFKMKNSSEDKKVPENCPFCRSSVERFTKIYFN